MSSPQKSAQPQRRNATCRERPLLPFRENPHKPNGESQPVGAGYSPDRGNVCEADKRVPVFGENPRPPERPCKFAQTRWQCAKHRGELRSPTDGQGCPSLRAYQIPFPQCAPLPCAEQPPAHPPLRTKRKIPKTGINRSNKFRLWGFLSANLCFFQ